MPADPYWNHNTHYHRWLLEQVPNGAQSALDVGCGDGLLAGKLAQRCSTVVGIDADAGILAAATGPPNVKFEHADFRTYPGTFDYVTAVASLHHVPLTEGLTALRELVAPGGTLAVVGLWKTTLHADLGHMLLLPVIMAIDLFPPRPVDPGAAVRDADDTLADIRRAAANILPGARIRRRLMWRYTLLWQQPAL